MKQLHTDAETAVQLGLTEEEFESIVQKLGRTPNFTELAAFSGMWSEHCSYKNSILWLKKLPKTSEYLLAEAGEENAGLVDIGDGLACAFKIESHNHPSAIEPFQGAATGVGGINRDIFTMGARPVAQLNALFFGPIEHPRTQWIMDGVVHGISSYGNAFGVPTVGGQTFFDEAYLQNPLVNVMSAGIVEHQAVLSAKAQGPGNLVYIAGAATGRDGVHGASFASGILTEESVKDLPSVQVGDPFMEKCLLEATLEAAKAGLIVAIQDMGAAGIICSTSEMSAKGNLGMDIDLNKVPCRQQGLQPFELLLSESQERMLIIVKPENATALEAIFAKWELPCSQIGTIIPEDRLIFRFGDEIVADIPASELVLGGGAPRYERAFKTPEYFIQIQSFNHKSVPVPKDLKSVARAMNQLALLAPKNEIFEQFDSMVGTATASAFVPSDAAVVRVLDKKTALALTLDVNPVYVQAHPELGTEIAVAHCAAKIVCSGGKPLAVTNCLNFGNPYDPEAYWQFTGAVKGLRKACLHFGTPVTGGNVSFYNQFNHEGRVYPILPTPTIGMLGLLEDFDFHTGIGFAEAGDDIFLLGIQTNCINSSVYLREICGIKQSPSPFYNRNQQLMLHRTLSKALRKKWLVSAHTVAEGGLFFALLESARVHQLGFNVYASDDIRPDACWFGEGIGRILISAKPENRQKMISFFTQNQVEITHLGEVTSGKISVDGEDWGLISEWTAPKLFR